MQLNRTKNLHRTSNLNKQVKTFSLQINGKNKSIRLSNQLKANRGRKQVPLRLLTRLLPQGRVGRPLILAKMLSRANLASARVVRYSRHLSFPHLHNSSPYLVSLSNLILPSMTLGWSLFQPQSLSLKEWLLCFNLDTLTLKRIR